MIKKILLPTDFSEQAHQAFEVACQLARRYNAELHLIHLVDLPSSILVSTKGNRATELPESLFFLKLAQKKFFELKAESYAEGINIREAVEFKSTHQGILDYCEEHSIDKIVMGSHGSSGLEELFIGSNTEKIVRNAKVPVLVIKKRHEDFKIGTCLFATDLEGDNLEPFKKIIEFTRSEKATLKLVYINTPESFKTTETIQQLYQNFCKELDTPSGDFEVYNDLRVERGIMNYAETIQADLISMGTHGRKGLAHFFNGSISEDLVNHAKRPVLTFKI